MCVRVRVEVKVRVRLGLARLYLRIQPIRLRETCLFEVFGSVRERVL